MTIDLARVRELRDELDAIAEEHPEAFDGRTAKEWEGIIEADDAGPCQVAKNLQAGYRHADKQNPRNVRASGGGSKPTREDPTCKP